MLLCPQLGPKSERSNLRATATIEKSFAHTGGDVAQHEARAAPTHEACSRTTKLYQTKAMLFCYSMHDIRPCHTAAILSRETAKALFYHAKPRRPPPF